MSAPLECPVSVGDLIAEKYRVEDVLGKGGMGLVVKATHLHLRKFVAIKFLLPEATPEVVERFRREAQLAACLSSAHVVRVIDVADLPNRQPYMVMEFLEGKDLARVLRQDGPLSVIEATLHVLGTCEAIAEAHAMRIVHRDLKPSNLFLANTAGGFRTVKVLDFGISKAIGDAADGAPALGLTKSSALLGSPLYMSPEQLRSARQVDQRSDIWSVGALFYEILTGRAAFPAQSLTELIMWVQEESPTPPGQLRPDLPKELEQAIMRCLQRNPVDRFQNIAELAWAIAPFGPPEAAQCAVRASRFLGLPLPQPAPQGHDSGRPPPGAPPPESSFGGTSEIPKEADADAAIGMESTIRSDNDDKPGRSPAERRESAPHAEDESGPPKVRAMPKPEKALTEQSRGRLPTKLREKQVATIAGITTLAVAAGIAVTHTFVRWRAGDVAKLEPVGAKIAHAAEIHKPGSAPIAAASPSNEKDRAPEEGSNAEAPPAKTNSATLKDPTAPQPKPPAPPAQPSREDTPPPSSTAPPPAPSNPARPSATDNDPGSIIERHI
ncbi:serine/threonine-protein kinase [Sorangium sp. So ce119]|uniref:serine/threonine-protein kinase n=1 Tax=Sorangium sp. So ce119 TaxID=3133279 RepID=UPI003F624112